MLSFSVPDLLRFQFPNRTLVTFSSINVQIQRRQGTAQCEQEGKPGSLPLPPPSYHSLLLAVTHIVQEEGFPGLYQGLSSSILNTVVHEPFLLLLVDPCAGRVPEVLPGIA
ncbi:hypothetical protein BO99DRAFT_232303 [Aspergillus violaceofuscus CBS 115571]|uniref:Uncharacterized protein n=1 Tax=Aspergillus violaceofuscus (strain CBS 115571) TaxID=1450538 RepID=A0A2V5GY88_ASPV1|nr:hypothetical protein BO99DRAFT_232303 [Aspergillus violaceofuscus CBS 115571]